MKAILKSLVVLLCGAVLLVFFVACSHPIEIVGNGDVLSASGNRDCYLEDFLAGEDSCGKNYAINDYEETYFAVPREGWQFDRWVNYCADATDNQCSFVVPAETVHQFWGQTVPPLQAVFTEISGPEICDGIDNDLDGDIDEDWPELGDWCFDPGLPEMGRFVCDSSQQDSHCVDGGSLPYLACGATVSQEVCNYCDDDLDSVVDEGFEQAYDFCVVGVGECRSEGWFECSSIPTEPPICNAVSGIPSQEVCDGLDNDCDGESDEGLTCP